MDGIGIGVNPDPFNAVVNSHRPTITAIENRGLNFSLLAHGTHVGLPDDELMGNSEVGHNALGAGALINQGATQVQDLIKSGKFGESPVLQEIIGHVRERGSALHLIGLLQRERSVHAHTDHLKAIVDAAAQGGANRIYVHGLTDGRDDPEGSAIDTVRDIEDFLKSHETGERVCMMASGGGRMVMTMDRYWADPEMLKTGWETHVKGIGRQFESGVRAVEAYYRESGNGSDQYCFPFVIARDGQPVGRIKDGDAVIFFNYRGDRAKEISKAFEDEEFTFFDRGAKPDVIYAGLLSYDPDENVPSRYIVQPPDIKGTMGELLAGEGISQLALSETQKYGHVTYFWNGNRAEKFDEKSETYIEITSDPVPEFKFKPWMKAAEIASRTVEEIRRGTFRFGRINFANGDMVGHTGDYASAATAVSAVDLGLHWILPAIEAAGGALIVTADHGNAEEMVEHDSKGNVKYGKNGVAKVKTSHTTNPVPCMVYAPGLKISAAESKSPLTIRNVAATAFNLLGYEAPVYMDPSLIRIEG
ncbi:MAG: phosphoglycerate mutase (2,3-diphosphoglycerate-independent) [Candidatus Wallbacteria bacterium HGW-Wallbacteria-1]|jgi:2,3-bisphosphoglycerate-independent phosphoglycerate mutase|uniref:2,3-bisphosphoglycerate-independent phosphoglycerate mutase n=1 Tax=Candidatus Wallbacteria bacterium HGW-Wallbacteria-1 TaxID=2013854 RepID=A0A2N1PIX2_9BACT|nr:MAG: phosphoglycerate mutase (2,3-diphosphoglycerate-independent) [Candidatus Wallbacteria bacterium HGW-Wallbacteria-1]